MNAHVEPKQAASHGVNFPLKGEERLELGVHFDLTDWEKKFLLDAVAFHVSLDNGSCVILPPRCCKFEKTFTVESLDEKSGCAASIDDSQEFASAIDCAPAALKTKDGIIDALVEQLHSEGHFEFVHGKAFHQFEV